MSVLMGNNQEQQILMELKISSVVQDNNMGEVGMLQQRKNNKQMIQEHLYLLSQLNQAREIMLLLQRYSKRKININHL